MPETIQTLRGVKCLCDIHGVCIHEHLLIDMTHEAVAPQDLAARRLFDDAVKMENLGALRRNPYIVKDNLILDSVGDAVREAGFLDGAGVDLILDLTTIGLGRDIRALLRIGAAISQDVVVGTGFFVQPSLPSVYESWTVEEMTELMLREITEGIDGTDAKAGVIGEVGVSETIFPMERRSLLATAQAACETGLPVFLHTYPWSEAGLDAVNLLLSEGVDASAVCVCHVDVSFNHAYMTRLLDRGVYLEFDNFGKEFYFPQQDGAFAGGPFESDRSRVFMLRRLIGEGWGNRLMAANDLCLKAMLRKYGGWGYDHLHTNIVPMMLREGIEERIVRRIILENPIAFLGRANARRN